ncbi:hypothetical protein [Glycomyces xiaoerkulensis]|uniref:hypothetical protein n=1 Tax=Glycomyces xiaoerkulensis TaxID=2038139 RepID=UPI001E35B5EF|nr:hypothetical protein [Glycomyces xiaoerkulensis]
MVFPVEIDELPQLADFKHHRTIRSVDFDGFPLPGLDADFYRRPVADRLLSVGVYRLDGTETHRAWGWVGEAHCSRHAYRDRSGGFAGPFPGCPELRVLVENGRAVAFDLGPGRRRRRFALSPGGPARADDRGDRDRQPDRESGALERM